jgi:sensor c-di-GMP phosphodiesterase-like protein
MAVNVSAVEFREKGFVENIRQILSDTGFRPHYLVLELTERASPKKWTSFVCPPRAKGALQKSSPVSSTQRLER